MDSKNKQTIRACVIGAGAAGLCAARHLANNPTKFVFDVYEQKSSIGGVWNYTDLIGSDENGLLHTSMYRNLRTNLPMQIMEFQDFPSQCSKSFVSHTRVLQYLEDYTKHFDLMKYIKFNHQILRVSRVSREDNFWEVIIKNNKTQEIIENIYDSIFVCNGRYSNPFVPKDIKGIEKFKGKILHSKDYRIPEVFTDMRVLILGAGPSGIDLTVEISEYAKQVLVCHQKKEPILNLRQNIIQEMSKIKEISENYIEFESGYRFERVDAFIYATGYCFDFSFLDTSCKINVNNGRVEGVYQHLINISHPSMAIWAIVMKVVPFPLYHQQVLFFIKCLTKELLLPSKTEMERSTQTDLALRRSMGLSDKHSHKMEGNLFFDYSDTLAQMANITHLKPVFKKLYKDLEIIKKNDCIRYKDMDFEIISDEQYVIK